MKSNIMNDMPKQIRHNSLKCVTLWRNCMILLTAVSLLSIAACSNGTENVITQSESPTVMEKPTSAEPEQTANVEQGVATVRMFVPDYYAMAEKEVSRAIAPQTEKARLSYLVNGSWVGINSVSLADAEKTPVENAPDNFTGSVYTCTFSGVPVGTYNAGNLMIELMDNSGMIITEGVNATNVTITKGGSANTTFYTVPCSTEANTGNLAAGEMKFSQAALVQGVNYSIAITTSGDYPDFVLFDSDGKLVKYYAVDSEDAASLDLTVDKTDVYYLGLWADDGNAVARYTLAFDFGEGTQIQGVLTGDNLHWTKANSPYIVNGNLLVEEGSELAIDAGVSVQFTGSYYLKVTGTISALGTKADPIIFVQSGDNLSSWTGITINSSTSLNVTDTYSYSSGNIMKNCMIIGANSPLTLQSSVYVEGCTFTGGGSVSVSSGSSLLINNTLDNGLYVRDGRIVNNNIKYSLRNESSYATFLNNTITNASINFYYYYGSFSANTINACSIYRYGGSGQITGNNFLGYNDTIINISNNSYSSYKSFNFTGNYWGEEQTAELNASGNNANISFFTDYYDNFENTKVNYSGWATEPIAGAGYQGDGFIAFDYTINGYSYNNGGYYSESTDPSLAIVITPQYHANEITSVRVAQSLADLGETDWSAYNANQSFTADKSSLVNGMATIYVQLKDSEDNVSSPLMHEVPFDSPVVTLSIADGAVYSAATSSVTLNFGATDNGSLTQYDLSIDDVSVLSSVSNWGTSFSNEYDIGLAYMAAGEHTVRVTFWDEARNATTKTVTFTINRTVDTSGYAASFDSTSGQLLKDSSTVYLWHLDSDGSEADGNESAVIGSYSAGTGGLGGYASNAYTSNTISLTLESAFTIECWRKGNNYFEIYKSDVFYFNSTSCYSYYKIAGGSVSNNYCSWNSVSDDEWHYYSFVYNGKYMAVYRDGVLLTYQDGFNQTLNSNENKLYISTRNIDELRISNIARTGDEIRAYYEAAKDKIQ